MSPREHFEPAPAIADKLTRLPTEPGVYVFYDRLGKAIYVGKATSLRSRVRSYFGRSSDDRLFHKLLVNAAVDVDVMVTNSPKEALILENTLIKRHRPRYNVHLRDDKTYASLALTVGEAVPRLLKVRQRRPKGAKVFGPFPSGSSLNATLKVLRAAGGIRTCTNADYNNRSRPCLEYEIGHCGAPCVGLQSVADYQKGVRDVLDFLRGKTAPVIARLTNSMNTAAEVERYEEAARWRDRIAALQRTAEGQRVVDPDGHDRDVFGWHRNGPRVTVAVLQVRDGTLVSSRRFHFQSELDDAALGSAVAGQLYTREEPPPGEVLLPAEPSDAEPLAAWLSEKRGKSVKIWAAQRGRGRELLELAEKNAVAEAARVNARAKARAEELAALAALAGLDEPPERIDCVDISHLGGTQTVASCIVFQHGEKSPGDYLKFKLQSVAGGDDPGAIREVVERRLTGGLEKGTLPDLLLIDGGAAQLAAAAEAVAAAGLEGKLSFAALVKESGLHTRGDTAERLWLPGEPEARPIPAGSAVLHLLQRIRDEAHRFAVEYQRALRRKSRLKSGLEEIPGIGPKRRKALLARFGSLKAIRAATEAEIRATPGLPKSAADALLRYLAEHE